MALTLHGNNGVITTNGTAAAPSLAAPDTDTGLYFGTNLIHATTSGSERLKIKADGKIEIPTTGKLSLGMSSPVAQFTAGTANGSRVIEIQGTDGVIRGFDRNSSAWAQIDFEASQYVFDCGGTERLRITSAGKVGINEDVPQATLHVASTSNYVDIGLSNSTSGHTGSDGANIFLNNSLELALWNRESTGIIRFATAGTERVRIKSYGYFKIK